VVADTLENDYDLASNVTFTANLTSETSVLENVAKNLTSDMISDTFKNNSVMNSITEDSVVGTTVEYMSNLTDNFVTNMTSAWNQSTINLSQVCTNPPFNPPLSFLKRISLTCLNNLKGKSLSSEEYKNLCWLNINGFAIPLSLQLLITVLIVAVILGQDIL